MAGTMASGDEKDMTLILEKSWCACGGQEGETDIQILIICSISGIIREQGCVGNGSGHL